MDITELKKNWEVFGEADPMYAILSDPRYAGGKWNPDQFFQSGRDEIQAALNHVKAKGVDLKRGRALDFGCGIGRLTQALAEHFDRADGIDIAQSMIDGARKCNRHGERAVYHVNADSDLRLFETGSFDFIYSRLVLQHMRKDYALQYMREFVRVLKPGGVALLQQPDSIKHTLRSYLRDLLPAPVVLWVRKRLAKRRGDPIPATMEMHFIKKKKVLQNLESTGARVVDVTSDGSAGETAVSYQYLLVKPG